MKQKTYTRDYASLIALQQNLDGNAVYQIAKSCSLRIIKHIEQGDDIHIEDCLNIMVNKSAKAKYIKKVQESSIKKYMSQDETQKRGN